ncbi:sensor histidine kinase [uncultured Draconibacterium sp.]|uniref:sensor histidine kinase n=1 Tax=uncultured Draconibacterium sp. TaxID=1573823 RepID=UPI0025CCE4BB|nr:histidine kinase [uncultured Draconibacterium sp.]
MRKRVIINWLVAIVVSILIGMVTTVLMGGSLKVPFMQFVWNAGYSLSLGLPLFANGYLFNWYEKRFIDWVNRPITSVVRALLMHIFYSSFVIWTVNWFWFIKVMDREWESFLEYNRGTIISEYIIFIIIASIIYAISFFKAWRTEVRQKEEVKRESLALQYKVLQDQINPHFLFNSLNVLGSLIDIDVEKAKQFTRELSKFYRDVLQFKDLDIISLKEEIDFVMKYIYLQQIRFGEALQVDIIANEKVEGKVIPLSVQALVENAIKHNEISKANPLKILVAISDDYELVVENNLQPIKQTEDSSKTGLKNLAGRYEYLTGKQMVVSKNGGYFRVSVPLIRVEGGN